jgi:hypothetical protein
VTPSKAPEASRLVLVLRVVMLLVAAVAVAVAFWVTGRADHAVHAKAGRYVCPMHPEVTADGPEECPICHMALEPRTAQPSASHAGHAEGDEPGAFGLTTSEARRLSDYSRFSHVGIVRKHTMSQEIVAPAWIEEGRVGAQLYKNDVAALETDERASFFAARAPTVAHGIRLIAEPALPWDRSTSLVHFRFEASPSDLVSREPGWVKLAKKPRSMLVVYSTAVLESAEGPYVLTYSVADRKFAKRLIEVGKVFSGLTAIISGVRERETVVEMNAFFMDAERRLRDTPELGPEALP